MSFPLVDNQLIYNMQQGGYSVLSEIGDVLSPIVHAIGQPIQNVWHDSVEVASSLTNAGQAVVRLGTYGTIAWLGWSAFGMYFPEEKYAVEESVDRALKRARLR